MIDDDRRPSFWDAAVPGERLEGRWRGLEEDGRGRATGRVETSDGERRFPVTSVLATRARRLPCGAFVRVVYEGVAVSMDGRPYHRHRIEELLEPPQDPELAPPRGQQSLPW